MKIKYRVRNFKSFSDSGELIFNPITLLCGVNSAGKSSIIKSILLTKQSSVERRSALSTSVPAQPLILNGELTKLGTWSETVTNKIRANSIEFQWYASASNAEYFSAMKRAKITQQSARPSKKNHQVKMSVTLSSDENKPEELSTTVDSWTLEIDSSCVTITRLPEQEEESPRYTISISNLGSFLSRDGAQIGRYALYLGDTLKALKAEEGAIELGSVTINSVGPFVGTIRPIFDDSWSDFFDQVLAISERHRGVKRGPRPKWIEQLETATKGYRSAKTSDRRELARSPTMRGLTFLALELVEEIARSFQQGKALLAPMWRDIRYLGPLRDQPRRFYQFDDTGGADVGVSGEFTVQVLALEQQRKITATQVETVHPGAWSYSDPIEDTLLGHTNHWLLQMDLPSVSPQSLQQSLYKLEVGELGVGLLDVGFGVSQVLPIVVEALRAQRGELVILEQPEIHLHPKVQAQLADFLIARAKDGVRFLVESHSEYLIKRLCRRVAESDIPGFTNPSSIYFVEGAPGQAKCRRVEVNEFGEIENWPKGFFDLDEDLYWTRATLNKRKSLKAQKRE